MHEFSTLEKVMDFKGDLSFQKGPRRVIRLLRPRYQFQSKSPWLLSPERRKREDESHSSRKLVGTCMRVERAGGKTQPNFAKKKKRKKEGRPNPMNPTTESSLLCVEGTWCASATCSLPLQFLLLLADRWIQLARNNWIFFEHMRNNWIDLMTTVGVWQCELSHGCY
jgi:hypothetical protein